MCLGEQQAESGWAFTQINAACRRGSVSEQRPLRDRRAHTDGDQQGAVIQTHTHTYNRGRCSFLCVFSSCRHLTGEENQAQQYAIKGTCSTQLHSFTLLLKVSCIAVPTNI